MNLVNAYESEKSLFASLNEPTPTRESKWLFVVLNYLNTEWVLRLPQSQLALRAWKDLVTSIIEGTEYSNRHCPLYTEGRFVQLEGDQESASPNAHQWQMFTRTTVPGPLTISALQKVYSLYSEWLDEKLSYPISADRLQKNYHQNHFWINDVSMEAGPHEQNGVKVNLPLLVFAVADHTGNYFALAIAPSKSQYYYWMAIRDALAYGGVLPDTIFKGGILSTWDAERRIFTGIDAEGMQLSNRHITDNEFLPAICGIVSHLQGVALSD